MREKIKRAVRDPLFLRLCLLGTAMIALAVTVIISYGKPGLNQIVIAAYAVYVPVLFFFIKTLVKLYKKYFREQKERKESKFRKKLRAVWRAFDEKIRQILNMKPKAAFFGGEDTEYDLAEDSGISREKKDAAARIKWSALRENRERIRFLYAEKVGAGISDGVRIAASDTARQVGEKLCKNERDELLFELYESVRYTDREREINDGEISYIREKDAAEKRKKRK